LAADLESAALHARHVHRIGTLEVPTLDEYDAWSGPQDPFTCGSHVVDGTDWHIGEDFCFRDVRRHDVCDPEQLRLHGRNRIEIEQSIATFRDHDRIDDDVW